MDFVRDRADRTFRSHDDQVRLNFQENAQCHDNAAYDRKHQLQPVGFHLKRLYDRKGQVRKVAKYKNNRKLQEIDQFIILAEKQDLNDDKDHVYDHGERTHGEREDLA